MSVVPSDIGHEYPKLSAPIEVGAIKARNHVAMASLTRSRATPVDVPNEHIELYYKQRAAGGAGLILSEGTLISPQGTEFPNVASLYSEEHVEGWKKVIDGVHKEGGVIVLQLWHVGRISHHDMPLQKKFGKPVSAPSPIAARGGKFRTLNDAPNPVPEREHPDPSELVDEYRQAAVKAKAAGADGVELHSANGYLVHQFLDKNSNHRTDKWGGSLENRCRFFVECLDAIVAVWGADRVGVKFNPDGGYNDVGMNEADTRETFNYVINYAVKLGLAYVQLVRYLPFMDPEFDGKQRAETHLDVLEVFGPLIKKEGSKTKLFLNGNLSAQEAEKLIEENKIDLVVFGRSFINNPDLPKRLFNKHPLNETLGHPDNMKSWYQFENSPAEGYTTFPTYEEASAEKPQPVAHA